MRTAAPTRPPTESFPASDPPAAFADKSGDAPHVMHCQRRRGRRPRRATRCRSASTASQFELDHGAVVIAAITVCTNTSNPQVMVGAALLAKKAVDAGLSRKPWVKTTLAPGARSSSSTTSAPG